MITVLAHVSPCLFVNSVALIAALYGKNVVMSRASLCRAVSKSPAKPLASCLRDGFLVSGCYTDWDFRFLLLAVPASIAGLRELDMSCAKLCCGIPASIGCCVKLTLLNLSHNRLAGKLETEVGERGSWHGSGREAEG